jgi:hypothetical protein
MLAVLTVPREAAATNGPTGPEAAEWPPTRSEGDSPGGYLVEIRTDRIRIYDDKMLPLRPEEGAPAARQEAVALARRDYGKQDADAAAARLRPPTGAGAGAEAARTRESVLFDAQHAYRKAVPLFSLTGLKIRAVQF